MKGTIAIFVHHPLCAVDSTNGIIEALSPHYRFKIFTRHEVEDTYFDDVDIVCFPGGLGDSDRFDGMPVRAAIGSRDTTLVIDHAVFNSELDALSAQPLMTIEAKSDSYLSRSKQLHQAHHQAKSYCFWTQSDFFMVTDGRAIHVFRVGRGKFDNIDPLFQSTCQDLKRRFLDLYSLVSKESLSRHYLKKLSATEEAT
jgi:hypothetical protein